MNGNQNMVWQAYQCFYNHRNYGQTVKHEIDCFVSVKKKLGKNRIFHRLQVLERQ